jgi:pyruvate-formate lyase-activating enzyme
LCSRAAFLEEGFSVVPRILLVNPPILDYSAYDFWLKPFGLLRVAGFLRGQADMVLFDYLDRMALTNGGIQGDDPWGRGEYQSVVVPAPPIFAGVRRRFRRYGRARSLFQKFLAEQEPFDFALIQTVMTYWYLGVKEVLEDLAAFSPNTKTVLGGVYATLCTDHARSLGADLVVAGSRLDELRRLLGLSPDHSGMPYWEGYHKLEVGVLKLAYGCPFRCTYCSVPRVEAAFTAYPLERALAELEFLCRRGAGNVAFYDDALLYRPDQILTPFLREVLRRRIRIHFHTPNALNARFVTRELAELMVQAGFRTFFLGFESNAYDWQRRTGGKVYSHELARAIEYLSAAGADREAITAYLIIGHPNSDQQEVEGSMRFAADLGVRIMLSEFSPIPGTPDGEQCRSSIDLNEPLWHNKTVFTARFLGTERTNRLKGLCRELNQRSRAAAI